MSSKLAWHFQGLPGWAPGLVNSAWVKVMDPPSSNPFPAARTIGRVYIPDNEANGMVMRGSQGAREWYGRCLGAYLRAPWVYCWEGPNEPPVAALEQRTALAAFTREWVRLMHQAGRRTVALCLGVGWPDVSCAKDLADALTDTDYWALHEYAAPTMQSDQSWLCLRYRRTVAELEAAGARCPPLLITECGIDGGTAGPPTGTSRPGAGWKAYCSPGEYLAQLTWYDGELQRDGYVQAATIFTSGPNANWQSFDVDESLSKALAAYIAGKRADVAQVQQDLRKLAAHVGLTLHPAAPVVTPTGVTIAPQVLP